MNLLIFTYEYPPIGGGGGQAAKYLAEGFARKGHQITVITSLHDSLKRRECLNGVTLLRVFCFRKRQDRARILEMIFYFLAALVKGWQEIKNSRPDFIFSIFSIPSGLAGLPLALYHQIPHFISLQGGDVPGFLGKELAFFHRITLPLTRYLWKKSRVVVANSKELADLALKTLTHFNLKIIPMGVNVEMFRPSTLANKEVSPFKGVFVGRLVEQKQPHYLLDAWSQAIKKTNEKIQLHIYGDGPLRSELENRVIEKNMQNSILFHGWIKFDHLPSELQKANVFLQTSKFEGMSAALLQAMACGLPCVVFRCQGQEMIVEGENGFIVQNQDVNTFAEKILFLIRKKRRQIEMGRTSRITAEKYNWSHICDQYLNLFDENPY